MRKWMVLLGLVICIFTLNSKVGELERKVRKYRFDFHECALKVYYLEVVAGKKPYWPFNTNTKTWEFDYLTRYAIEIK